MNKALFLTLFVFLIAGRMCFGQSASDSGKVKIPMMDDLAIYGQLMGSKRAEKLVLIVPARVGLDLDGNPDPHDKAEPYKQLAEALREKNIASFRYEMRGVGESVKPALKVEPVTMDMHIRDLRELVDNLNATYTYANIYLMGHGEGAILAAAVASEFPLGGLVYFDGPATSLDSVLLEQLQAMDLGLDLNSLMDSLQTGQEIHYLPEELKGHLGKKRQAYLFSARAHDPKDYLKSLKCPALLVYEAQEAKGAGERARNNCSNCELVKVRNSKDKDRAAFWSGSKDKDQQDMPGIIEKFINQE